MTETAPILLFVYNRPAHTRQTLEALSKNELADQSRLYIFCDGPKDGASSDTIALINETRQVAKAKQWTKEVIIYERQTNHGLANSIVKGVTEIVNKYNKVIVLEDDLITSKGFLKYMNDALTHYEFIEDVMHISGYWFPVKDEDPPLPSTFFYRSSSCWGWATWKRAWNKLETDAHLLRRKIVELPDGVKRFNIENSSDHFLQLEDNILGKINTWAVKWYASVFLNRGLCLHPAASLVNNIGFDNSGVNCKNSESDRYHWESLAESVTISAIELSESALAVKRIKKFYRQSPAVIFHLKQMVPTGLKSFIKKNILNKN